MYAIAKNNSITIPIVITKDKIGEIVNASILNSNLVVSNFVSLIGSRNIVVIYNARAVIKAN